MSMVLPALHTNIPARNGRAAILCACRACRANRKITEAEARMLAAPEGAEQRAAAADLRRLLREALEAAA